MLGRLLVVALTFFTLAARACDLCGCYTPQLESMPKDYRLRASVAVGW